MTEMGEPPGTLNSDFYSKDTLTQKIIPRKAFTGSMQIRHIENLFMLPAVHPTILGFLMKQKFYSGYPVGCISR